MPKVIQPRRHDKTLDVQEFWNIRNSAKKTQVASAPHPYKEEEVAQRHRYKKPSQQAKTFNPLALLLRRERNNEMNDLYQIGGEDQNTHVSQFLTNVQYRVTSGIVAIKKLVMGRKSIVHNTPKILNILLQHLDYEDTWPLLQAVLKDTPQVDIAFWLEQGFRRLLDGISDTIGTNFNQIVFRNFFDTICVFMQTYFEQISQKLTDFVDSYSETLFANNNKYIRKFAVQAFSYVLTNISEQQYNTLINYLVDNQHTLFNEHVSLAQVLVQRLKIVKGCLSAASLTHFLGQLQLLSEIFQVEAEQSKSQFNTLIEQYIGLVLSELDNRQPAKDDQILFDFNYVLAALISFCNKNKQIFGVGLLRGCSKFINLYKTDRKRLQPYNNYQTKYMNEMWSKLEHLFKQNFSYFSQSAQFFYSLSVLIVKGTSSIYYDQNILIFSKKNSQFISYLLEVVYDQEQPVNNSIFEVVLLLSKHLLKQSILGSNHSQLVYKLIVVLKRSGFSKLIQTSWIQVQNQQIVNRLLTAQRSGDLLVLLRLVSMLRIVLNSEQLQKLWSLRSQVLDVYQNYLANLMSLQHKNQNSAQQLYNFQAFSKEIIVFSHHEIGWLSHIFNLFEAFTQAFQHFQNLSGISSRRSPSSVWNELIVSRPSAVKILKKNGYLTQSFTNSKIALNLLCSRNRQVRWNTLQSIIPHFHEESNVHKILSKLLIIDQEQIVLDNQRQVKRYFCQLQEDINCINNLEETDRQILLEYLLKWSIGFAFTGFKLIETAFITFFSKLLDFNLVHSQTNATVVSEHVMPFLEYYHYRHSRQYDYDIQQSNHLINAFHLQTDATLAKYVKEDLQIAHVDTVEWIGLHRITEAVKVSTKGKQNLGGRLQQLVNTYFSVEFNRRKNNIILGSQNAEIEVPKAFTNPIKTRFLVMMLKICPTQIVPPYECLHLTREEFFDLPSIKKVKKNNWQNIWEKKKATMAKKKIEVEQKASTTVNLEHLGHEEQEIYLHYLWKDILENNRHKKRIIFDHIRTYLPIASQRILQIFFQSLFIDDLLARKGDVMEAVSQRLSLINRKQLLNYMFILKSMLIHMRQQINEGDFLEKIILVIIAIIKVIYISKKDQTLIGETEQVEGNQNQDEKIENNQQEEPEEQADHEDEENIVQEKGQISDWLSYKQHRKQLQKLLHTLFEHHYLSVPLIEQLLEFLLRHSKTNLSKSCRVSIPGFLLILNIVSQTKQYCYSLAELHNGQIVKMLAQLITSDKNGSRPLTACYKLWINIISNLVLTRPESMQDEKSEQQEIDKQIRLHSDSLLRGMLSYINGKESEQQIKLRANFRNNQKKQSDQFLQFLRIADKLMKLQTEQLQKEWEEFIWDELSKVTKTKKNFNAFQCEKLNLIISILSRYIQLKVGGLGTQSKRFIRRIIGLLPSIKDNQQRLSINQLISTHHTELGLSQGIVLLVSNTSDLIKNALQITMNFPLFFQSCSKYSQSLSKFALVQHEYFLHNLLCYVDHQELSVRRAVSNCNKQFLNYVRDTLNDKVLAEESKQQNKQAIIELVLRIYRVQLDLLHKLPIQQNDSVFWSIVGNIGYYVNWIAECSHAITAICQQPNAELYGLFTKGHSEQQNIFSLFTSISESNKLKALKLLRSILSNIKAQDKQKIIRWETHYQIDIPHVITKAILPILEYLVIHPTEFIPNNTAPKSNLASSLSLLSLEILPLVSSFLKESSIKKQLKRFVSKLKFSDAENKKNIALIKMISEILEGVEGERANEKLKIYLKQHGFEEFHNKIAEHATVRTTQDQDDDNQSAQVIGKKQKIPDYYDNLQELESEEAINRNFMRFDKKLMEIEDQNQQEGQSDFNFFLRKQVLLPLRTMLMLESKTKEEEEQSKSKVLLSVTITKVLLHLPMDTFLREFQKIVGKLSRLLKKRAVEVRQNARNCLCEIAKSIGPQLLYSIIMELRFNLKDNFDRHVFNYTVHRLLQVMQLTEGQLDYCIPLVLPLVVDEIYGQSSQEKQLIERGQLPTLKMQAKKRKGLELLQVLCRYISHHKINYVIQYLQKYLREHLITQENLGKYDQMLGAISSGLASNKLLIDPSNTPTLLPALSQPITKLRQQIKILNWENKAINQNTVKNSWKRRKAGKDDILTLQQEAGRNKSIFKRMTKQIGEKRNKQIVASSLVQFYLVLLSLLIRKQVFTIKSLTQTLQMGHQMINLLSFLNQCVDHRDNRLVSKSLKILHLALGWNASQLGESLQVIAEKFKSLKKQVSRKMMLMIEQLTLADQQLLKECFVFLNDLVSEVNIQPELLPSMTAIIKLHMPTTQDQPHIAETYKLLRTIVIKAQQHIYNPLLDDLHKLVKLQLVTCHNKEIREISKNILSVYLRPKSDITPRIQAHNSLQKKQSNKVMLVYEKVMKQQLTFYLSNLQCQAQQNILQLLEEFIQNRESSQLQTFAELILLSLMTARTNQVIAEVQINRIEAENAIDKLLILILKKLNQNKVINLVQKCLTWLQSERLSTIRLCGASFLRMIIDLSSSNFNKNFVNQYINGQNGIMARIGVIFQEEANEFQINQTLMRKQHLGSKKSTEQERRDNKEWNLVLDMMQVSSAGYQTDPSLTQLLHIFIILSKNDEVRKSLNPNKIDSIICSIWKLLGMKDVRLLELLIQGLQQHKIVTALSQYQNEGVRPFYDEKSDLSFKKTISLLLFHDAKLQSLSKLVKQIITEQVASSNNSTCLKVLSNLLIILALKAHIKPNFAQRVLPNVLSMLNQIVLSDNINGFDLCSSMFQEENFEEKLIQVTVKLASNELITYENKNLIQQTTEILKQKIGAPNYFKAVGLFETNRRERKEREKVQLAQLAITDPQRFAEQRSRKRRKLQ